MEIDNLKKEYKYYFMMCEHPNLYTPWSFEGIMGEIQQYLYSNMGLDQQTINSRNLKNRIDNLSPDKRQIAYLELTKAIDMATRKNGQYGESEELSHNEAVDDYRKAWKAKSFFYKIAKKNINPKNIDFDNLSVEEIKIKTSYLR